MTFNDYEEKVGCWVKGDDMNGPVVVLLSGGIDSAVAAAVARDTRPGWFGLTLSYGQTHQSELWAAKRIAHALGAEQHLFLECDLRSIAPSPLTGDGEIPVRTLQEIREDQHTSPVYVPARNLIFASMGVAYALSIESGKWLPCTEVWLASTLEDRQSFPDCRPAFFDALSKASALVTPSEYAYSGVEVRGPLGAMSKSEVIRLGVEKGVPLELTVSCYVAEGMTHCGRCDACLVRKNGFFQAGVLDPTRYTDPYFADQMMLEHSRSKGSKEI